MLPQEKIIFSTKSNFFDAGNATRELSFICRLTSIEEIDKNKEKQDLENLSSTLLTDETWVCSFNYCGATISLANAEKHYQIAHQHVCNQCKSTFPTHHLLDMHLSEQHDSYFKALSKRKPMYQCVLVSKIKE